MVDWTFRGRSGGHVVKFTHASWVNGEDGGGEWGRGANAVGTWCSAFASRSPAERIVDTLGLSRTAAKRPLV